MHLLPCQDSLHKIPYFQLIFWCGHFVETRSFRRVLGELSKNLWKLYVSIKFPHQKTKWNCCTWSNDSNSSSCETKRGVYILLWISFLDFLIQMSYNNSNDTVFFEHYSYLQPLTFIYIPLSKLILSAASCTWIVLVGHKWNISSNHALHYLSCPPISLWCYIN